MSPIPRDRPRAREAGSELLILQHWERFCGWLLDHTAKWPKAARFTLTQRVENHALDVTEMLVQARYDPRRRGQLLHEVNLRFERVRFLCRIARDAKVMPHKGFETAMREVDAAGKMLYGWREALRRPDRSKDPA